MSEIRTRFAPSPTGDLHVGGARTALFAYLVARHTGGQFILRIEDTDKERSTQESVDAILQAMDWLGLDYDEGPFYQTQRFDRYREVMQQLLDEGKAYRCYCSKERLDQIREAQMSEGKKPRYDGHCRDQNLRDTDVPHVIRFRNPTEGVVAWKDLVKGDIAISNEELDDMIIWRSDDTPTYNFTVVVDDLDMRMTHVIRGDDHVNNTPRQINLFNALNADIPLFAHVPTILGEDGKRLSKRHGATSVMAYREEGYLPEAMLNYLARLGWSHGDQEVFAKDELVSLFKLENVNTAAACFDSRKLSWLNAQYIKTLPVSAFKEDLLNQFVLAELDPSNGPALEALVPVMAERVETLAELVAASHYFYSDFDGYEEKAAKKAFKEGADKALECALAKFEALDTWENEPLHQIVKDVAEALDIGMGKIGMPLRVAVTGGGQSPGIDDTLRLIGKERVLARVKKAIAHLSA